MVQLTPTQTGLYKLVEVFIERQKLVLIALKELRPDIVARYEATHMPEEMTQLTLKYRSHPQTGYWGENKEWKYFLHGGGCRLTNQITGEPIEWDMGAVERFDKSWFVNWLIWLLETLVMSPFVIELSDKDKIRHNVYKILDELEKQKLLIKENQYYKIH